jgi:hypothetical protein
VRGYSGAVATRPSAGFGRVISRGGPNLVLTRVVTAPNNPPRYVIDIIISLPLIVYNYSTCRTNRVLTRSVRRVRVYAFGTPGTRLRVRYAGYAFTRSVHQPPAYASGALLRH